MGTSVYAYIHVYIAGRGDQTQPVLGFSSCITLLRVQRHIRCLHIVYFSSAHWILVPISIHHKRLYLAIRNRLFHLDIPLYFGCRIGSWRKLGSSG